MGPTESLFTITSGFYKELKRSGLTPFDPLSWEALKNLWTCLVPAGRRGMYSDRKIHQMTTEMVWAALERKAEAYQMEQEDERYAEELEQLRAI